jgi:hypothetical protein
MSEPFSRYLHPFEVVHNPSLEPEVKRAILARWVSDRSAVKDHPVMRKPRGARRAVAIDDIFSAMHTLDQTSEQCART